MRKPVILSFLFLCGCDTYEGFSQTGPNYLGDGKYIYVLERVEHKTPPPMWHGAPPTTDLRYFPFVIDREGKAPRFIGYCKEIDYEGPFEPLDFRLIDSLTGPESVKKSCGLKDISILSNAAAGRPWAFAHPDEGNFVNFRVDEKVGDPNLVKKMNSRTHHLKLPLPDCCGVMDRIKRMF